MSLNLEQFKSELDRIEGTNRTDFLKDFVKMPQKEGYVVTRILPPREDHDTIYVAVRNHTINGKRVQCARELVGGTWKGECPICNHYSSLWKQSDSTDLKASQVEELRNIARAIKPVERYFYNVLVRKQVNEKTGETEYNVGPLKLSVGKELHTYIIKSIVGDATKNKKGYGDITDINTGRDLNIVKSLRGEFPSYTESEFMEVSPLLKDKDKNRIKEILSSLHDLKAHRKPPTYEALLHEVDVFKGLEKDDAETFRKEDYEQTTKVASKPERVPVATVAKVESAPFDTDTSINEDDYLKDLDIDSL